MVPKFGSKNGASHFFQGLVYAANREISQPDDEIGAFQPSFFSNRNIIISDFHSIRDTNFGMPSSIPHIIPRHSFFIAASLQCFQFLCVCKLRDGILHLEMSLSWPRNGGSFWWLPGSEVVANCAGPQREGPLFGTGYGNLFGMPTQLRLHPTEAPISSSTWL